MRLSFAFPWIDPRDTHGNPGGIVQFWYSCFPHGYGELFSFGNDFPGPRGDTQGICSSFGQRNIALDQSFLISFRFMMQCDRQGEKCFTWYHVWLMWDNQRKARKKIGYICFLFLSMKFGLTLKG